MKVEVSILLRDHALVIFTPSWVDRLFGESIEERVAVALPSLPGGHRAWYWSAKGTPVPHRIARMIEAEVVKQVWERIWERRA